MRKDVTEIIDRNLPSLRGKGFISGYPKLGGRRMYRNVHSCISWREYAIKAKQRFAQVMSKYTPEEILAKMQQT